MKWNQIVKCNQKLIVLSIFIYFFPTFSSKIIYLLKVFPWLWIYLFNFGTQKLLLSLSMNGTLYKYKANFYKLINKNRLKTLEIVYMKLNEVSSYRPYVQGFSTKQQQKRVNIVILLCLLWGQSVSFFKNKLWTFWSPPITFFFFSFSFALCDIELDISTFGWLHAASSCICVKE